MPPPFPPLFSNFQFWKILNLKFYQNQKSTSYHIWFQIYSLIKSKNRIFRWNRRIWGSDWKSIIDQNRWFSSIINKHLGRLIFRSRDDINFIFGAKYSWGNVFYDLEKIWKVEAKGGLLWGEEHAICCQIYVNLWEKGGSDHNLATNGMILAS